jgi:Tfp pilus assembly protein PilN
MTGFSRRGAGLAVVLFPDRLAAAVVHGGRVTDTFSIVDAERPAEALRAELERRGLGARKARLALCRGFVTVKPVTLPVAADGDLAQMVRFELERHVPFAADDAAFDFTPLPAAEGGPRVLVAAAERRAVERAVQLLAEMRVRPVSLSVAAHDLVGLVRRRPAGQRVVWMHRAAGSTDLLFLDGPSLVLSRSVPAMDLETIVPEIRGSLVLLRWTECAALWVSGDGAEAARSAAALGELGITVEPPPLSPRARRDLGAVEADGDGATLLAAAVAVGARPPSLNLLPVALRPRRITPAQKLTTAMLVVTAGLGIAALVAPAVRDQHNLSRLDAEVRSLDPQIRALERVTVDLERERKLLETLQTVGASSLRPLHFLRDLTELLPPDAWLTALTIDQKGAELTGQAGGASALIPLLENSPRLERVEFVSPVTRGRDKEQFRIRAAWEVAPPSAAPSPATPASAARPPRPARPRAPVAGQPAPPPTPAPTPSEPDPRVPR